MQIRYRKFASNRAFGIELESSQTATKESVHNFISTLCDQEVRISAWSQSKNNCFWEVKTDSTCGRLAHLKAKDYGLEVASYKGFGLEDIIHISSVGGLLGRFGLEANPNCGFHIHGEVVDFKPTHIGVLAARWIKIEPIISCLVKIQRIKNKHCKPWRSSPKVDLLKSYTGLSLWKAICPQDISPTDNDDRRMTLNFVNYASSLLIERAGKVSLRKTVELRLPEGTFDADDISNWIKLFIRFIDSCRYASMPNSLAPILDISEFFRFIELEGSNSFYLLDPHLHQLKKWILNKIINSSWVANTPEYAHYFDQASDKLKLILSPKNS